MNNKEDIDNRFNENLSTSFNLKLNVFDKKKQLKNSKTNIELSIRNKNIEKKQSVLQISPIKTEKKQSKEFKFNLTVEEMTKYYINEDTVFHFKHFFETLIIHILYFFFGPIMVIIIIRCYGKFFIRNLGFWGKKLIKSHLLQIFFYINFVTTLTLSFIILKYNDSNTFKNQYIFLTPSYLSLVFILIRYIIVCVKD